LVPKVVDLATNGRAKTTDYVHYCGQFI